MGGTLVIEFVGHRAKMYSVKAIQVTKKTAKGISTSVKEKEIRHEDYKTSLFNSEQMTHKQVRIMQREHELYTVETQKTSLSPFNDKKWITRKENIFTSYSYGHYKIKK